MSQTWVQETARRLEQARLTGIPIAPLSEEAPSLSLDDAYAIQREIVACRLAAGAVRQGWKIGLTSQAMQAQLGVKEPDFAPLLSDMSAIDGGTIDPDTMIAPRVEAEIALRLRERLAGPGIDPDAALAACDLVAPALEIIDSRIADWKIKLGDTVADMASSAQYVIGDHGVLASSIELPDVQMTLMVDGRPVSDGKGSAVVGSPANAVAWLANTLARWDQALDAGDWIMAGALGGAVPLPDRGELCATFSEGLGEVCLNVGRDA